MLLACKHVLHWESHIGKWIPECLGEQMRLWAAQAKDSIFQPPPVTGSSAGRSMACLSKDTPSLCPASAGAFRSQGMVSPAVPNGRLHPGLLCGLCKGYWGTGTGSAFLRVKRPLLSVIVNCTTGLDHVVPELSWTKSICEILCSRK